MDRLYPQCDHTQDVRKVSPSLPCPDCQESGMNANTNLRLNSPSPANSFWMLVTSPSMIALQLRQMIRMVFWFAQEDFQKCFADLFILLT
jgi:hypothetical protein